MSEQAFTSGRSAVEHLPFVERRDRCKRSWVAFKRSAPVRNSHG